jgi:hypothetical protein
VNIRAEIPSGGAVLLKLKAKGDSLVGTYELVGPNAESGSFAAGRIRK